MTTQIVEKYVKSEVQVAVSCGPRIALFSGNYNYVRDGANQALNRLVRYAEAQLGATVRVYSPTTDTPAFEPAGELISVPSLVFPGRPEFRLAWGMPRRIRADLVAFAPDLVHLSAPDPLGHAALKWARLRGLPVVTSVHTRFETYFDYYGLGWLRGRIERTLDAFYRRSDFVLAPTPPIHAELAEVHGGRVRLWGRGVDHGCFTPERRDMAWRRSLGYPDDTPILLYFGRLVREKGVFEFAEVVRRLRAQGQVIRPLIVGDGPERKPLEAALPNAVFLGHIDRDPLWRAVASSDIFLMPSRTEAFGNVVLEAMAAGLAVVGADVGSVRQIATHGRDALLCPPGDIGAYAEAVTDLLGSPALRERLGIAARRASNRFDWDTALEAALQIYREALSGEKRSDRHQLRA